ncbi:MAG: hypothetical protein AAFW75_19845 [Cyanobacteria bacterium J06636_16]
MDIPDNASQLPMGQQPKQPPLSAVLGHPASRYQVRMRVALGEETWIVTALDFIFNKAILRQVTEEGAIDCAGKKREVPLLKLPTK